jgi:glutamine synthetase
VEVDLQRQRVRPRGAAGAHLSRLLHINSTVEAIQAYTNPKNVAMFEELYVLNARECAARERVLLNNYTQVVEIEAKSMVDMLRQNIIPSIRRSGDSLASGKASSFAEQLEEKVNELEHAIHAVFEEEDLVARANLSRQIRLERMVQVRALVDEIEGVVPADRWPVATYKELLFMDQHHSVSK